MAASEAEGQLAYHLDAARDYRRAVPALIRAGAEAEHAYAFGVARRLYERALELWDRAATGGGSDAPARATVMHRAAECCELLGAHVEAIKFGRDAIALLERDDRPDSARLGELHDRLRWYLWEAGDVIAAEAAVAEALRLIPGSPPSATRARALGQAAGLRMTAGDLGGASELAGQAFRAGSRGGRPRRGGVRSRDSWLVSGGIGGCRGRRRDVSRDGLAIAERIGGPEGIALGHANLAALLDRVGRTDASLAEALEGVCDRPSARE